MFGKTPLVMIEDTAQFHALVDRLMNVPVIGIDTEGDSLHHYRERVCLVQLSDASTDYIIDPLKVDDMTRLGELTAHKDQILVLHGGDYDVVSLKRDFGCQFANIFDTMIASQFLGLPRIGLADLIKRYFGHHIDKKYQRHDWSERPLEPEHLDYARGDTHWLLALREVLLLQLQRQGKSEAHAEECDLLALREWGGRGGSAANFLRVKRANTLDEKQLRVLRSVWTLRDQRAEESDKPPFKIMPDEVLINVSVKQPIDLPALKSTMRPGSSLVRRYGEDLVKAVLQGLEDTEPLPSPEPKKAKSLPPSRVGRAGGERIFNALKSWRNETVNLKKLAPVVVASNDLLRGISRLAPMSIDDLAEVPGIRQWQIESFGEAIVEIVIGQEVPLKTNEPKAKRRRRRNRSKKSEPQTADASTLQSDQGE